MVRFRRRPRPPWRFKPWLLIWRLTLSLIMLLLLAVLLAAGVGFSIYLHVAENLPDPSGLARHRPFETTQIYARDGQTLLFELVDPNGGRRTLVAFDRIPQLLKDATIAVEDADFYRNPGFDLRGVIRAVWLNYQAQEVVSGGSTITQQLVRSVLLPPEEAAQVSYQRKLREIILAYRVSQEFSKDQILNLYLNEVYYGAQAYGVGAAAQTYFGRELWELNPAELTLLAGLPQSPTVYNPANFTVGGVLPGLKVESGWLAESYVPPGDVPPPKLRQLVVLRRMVEESYLTEADARAILATDLQLVEPQIDLRAPHFVFYVRDLLERRYGPDQLYRGGLRIVTTIDLQWQAQAQELARARIAELRERDASNAAVVMLSHDGQILAMVGSIDFRDPGIDGEVNLTTSPRQPGSTLKPLIYAAALQHGWTPATVIWDQPTTFSAAGGAPYAPTNYDGRFHGPMRLRMALANSLNIPAVKALEYVSIPSFVSLARQLGITTFEDSSRYGLAMALGSNEVRLLELTGAYNVLANGGYATLPVAVLRVSNSRGEVIEDWSPERRPPQQLLGPDGEQIAYLITSILSDNQARRYMFGAGNVMELGDGRLAAVKTGTSDDFEDSWAIGYTPQVTIGVWVGNSDNRPMQEVAGANGAGMIWRALIEAYHAGQPIEPFPRPSRIVEATICPETGGLAGEACRSGAINELFVAGTEPQSPDISFIEVQVAGDGNCLPGPYTPQEQIRTVRYSVYPPAFKDWAVAVGIPQPPTQLCTPPADLSPEQALASIVYPGVGYDLSGDVFVRGTAQGPYTLEWGRGVAPETWNPLLSGNNVRDDLLGIWHTSALEPGPYTLRLRVAVAGAQPVEVLRTVQIKPVS